MLQGITIASLLSSLMSLGNLIVKIVLLYLVMRICSSLFVWICRTLIIPIFEKRAYFYSYNSEGEFYSERPILGLFRFGRNYRSRINSTLVGYIATRQERRNENPGSNKIYLRSKGRELIGEAKSKYEYRGTWTSYTNKRGESVCNIYLTNSDQEGGYEVNPNPVGYVDKDGRIFKYYSSREDWLKDKRLDEPVFIGQAETPKTNGRVQRDETNGERNDADVLKYIQWEANNSNFFESEDESGDASSTENHLIDERRTYLNKNRVFQMDDTWLFFRRNRPLFKKVKSKEMKGGCVKDGARFPYAFLSSKLWRILHVYPCNWPCKAKAWGYGYCTESFRNPFKKDDDDFPMITRAAAALLLARKEGFYRDADEVISDGIPGPAATALLSLFIYILLFPLLTRISSITLFPFLGKEYSSVITLIGYYFILWLLIINPIRYFIRINHDWLEAFLELLNRNVGVLGWMSTIVVSLVIGLLGSFFLFGMDYIFFPLFFSALTAVLVNWAYYHQQPWAISGIHDDFEFDDSEDEDSEQEEEQQEGSEKIKHHAQLTLPTKTVIFDEIVLFDPEKLKQLRLENPFRKTGISSYESTVQGMIYREFREEVYSKILFLKSRVAFYVNKYHLSTVEKVKLIMSICQPDNIVYEYDHLCPELYKGFDDDNPMLQKSKNEGFVEYCRFPTETIHDKRGDCDCHAAFGAALLAACGFRSCFSTGPTDQGYHAMCGIECTPDLQAYRQKDNSFTKDGKTFILLETVGKFDIEDVMEYQKSMSAKNTTEIIEPYNKEKEDDEGEIEH